MSATGTPQQADLLQEVVAQALRAVRVALPGTVAKVYTDSKRRSQWVDVVPGVESIERDESGGLVGEALPTIPMVPLGQVHGGGMMVSVPVKNGDHVLLVFADFNIDQWVRRAKTGSAPINPGHLETHGLNGAMAYPIAPPAVATALADVSPTDLVIGLDGDAGAQIKVTPGGEIHLGGSATYVARADKTTAALDKLVKAIKNAAVPSTVGSGAVFQQQLVQILDGVIPMPPDPPPDPTPPDPGAVAIDTNVAASKTKTA